MFLTSLSKYQDAINFNCCIGIDYNIFCCYDFIECLLFQITSNEELEELDKWSDLSLNYLDSSDQNNKSSVTPEVLINLLNNGNITDEDSGVEDNVSLEKLSCFTAHWIWFSRICY
ncbi:unnamed protein product [Lepeophtheirus salmonis]|uniref:(salmon louse) hypothetical protein n=1 Tax=Lepeophtheirus salmonis TaxID=72036 RepID=A0A7R8CRF1_LEPSM|nr:unnamed protein product [Lepeophtheirus salmonis]CAF2902874.1 unnamed protein product [Lepeophtheirus salmonis]